MIVSATGTIANRAARLCHVGAGQPHTIVAHAIVKDFAATTFRAFSPVPISAGKYVSNFGMATATADVFGAFAGPTGCNDWIKKANHFPTKGEIGEGMRCSAMIAKVPAPKKTFGGDSAAEDHTGCDAQDGPGRSHAWW